MKVLIAFTISMFMAATLSAQSTEFTYQGSLKDGASVANGSYDFEFRAFTALSGGSQIGSPLARNNVAVVDGVFAVNLDFATLFTGPDRYIEISVRPAGGGALTTLSPRQRVTSSPYAITSLLAQTANNSNQLGGVAANQFVQTGDPRLIDARPPTGGSNNYIQNSTTLQNSANFTINGNGTALGQLSASVVNSGTSFNIGGSRVLAINGTTNTYVGLGTGSGAAFNSFFGAEAGAATTNGDANAFFGSRAGKDNTSGRLNAFFGSSAGTANQTGSNNTFLGRGAGFTNTASSNNSYVGHNSGFQATGGSNSFFGSEAGFNTTGNDNVFVGNTSGDANTSGEFNVFVGSNSGGSNQTGSANTFVGTSAGSASTGTNNTFVGRSSGNTNTTGDNNTSLGHNSDVSTGNLNFATAIGAGAVATESNSVWLGRAADIVYVPGFLRLQQLGGAGATAICRNNANTIGTCSSSLRYKTNISQFGLGISLINQLKPITFDWRDGGMHDLGLGAEDVAAIEPLLVTYNTKGQVEGVKYDRIGVVLVNAVKEQQAQIEAQQRQIELLIKVNQELQERIRSVERQIRKDR